MADQKIYTVAVVHPTTAYVQVLADNESEALTKAEDAIMNNESIQEEILDQLNSDIDIDFVNVESAIENEHVDADAVNIW